MSIKCCLNCGDRIPGCHSSCDKYIKAKEEHDRLNETNHRYRMDSQAAIERVIRLRKYQHNK